METPRHPAQVLLALLLACALIAGSAVASAQDDAAPADSPAEEGTSESAEQDTGKGKKRRNQQPAEAECEAVAVGDGERADVQTRRSGDAQERTGTRRATRDAQSEDDPCEPPRCEDNQVDLAPSADEPNCVDRARLNRLLADFEAAAAEEAAALDELAGALDTLEELNELLVSIQLRLGEVQLRLAAARSDLGYAAIREAIAAEGLSDVEAALSAEEDRLREQAVEAYMGGDRVELASAAAVIELEGFAAQQTAREYASVVIGEQLATVDEVDALRLAIELLGEVVAAIERDAAADARRVVAIEQQVDDLLEQQRQLVADAEAETEVIAEKIAEIQARKQAYAEELRISGAGGGAVGETLRIRQQGQTAPENPAGLFILPLAETRIGSPFGPRVHPIFNDTRLHAGVDLSGRSGEPIMAAAAGVVVMAEEVSGYGNVVVVDHGNTLATLYAHMTADAVNVGQDVEQGELLGFVGSTGYSTGPHLHFEVRVLGTPVNPILYLRF